LHPALKELDKALEIQEDNGGVQEDTVVTLNIIANVLKRLGRPEGADEMTEREMNYRRNLEDRLSEVQN